MQVKCPYTPIVIISFLENNIDLTCLDGLGEEELKLLIPDNRLRDRIKFKQGFKKYKDEIETVHSVSNYFITTNVCGCTSGADSLY